MANQQSVTISFVAQSASDDLDLSIEMDDEKNADVNSGRTSGFIFGDEAFFRVYVNKPLDEVTVTCYESDGQLGSYGTKDSDEEELLTFTQPPASAGGKVADNTANTSKSIYGSFSARGLPYGSSPCGVLSPDPVELDKVNASKAGPGVYEVTYESGYFSFSIRKDNIPPGWDTSEPYPIVIVAVGE